MVRPCNSTELTAIQFDFGQQYRRCINDFIYFYYSQNDSIINSIDYPSYFTSTAIISNVGCDSDEFCCSQVPTPTPTPSVTPTLPPCLGQYNEIATVGKTTDSICDGQVIRNGKLVIGSLVQWSIPPGTTGCSQLQRTAIPIGCKWFRDYYEYSWDSNCNRITKVVTNEYVPDSQRTVIMDPSRVEDTVPCEGCRRVVVRQPVPGTLRNNCGIPFVK